MSIEEFKHLWDGSEPGWALWKSTKDTWHLTFHFSTDGPDSKQISHLRQLVPELMGTSLPAAHQRLKGCSSYRTSEGYSNLDAHEQQRKALALGLQASVEVNREISFLPVRNSSLASLIEDDELAREVASRMIAAGVPVVENHSG